MTFPLAGLLKIITILINSNPSLFFICIFFLLWWIPAEINVGYFCILLSILSIPKSKIAWRRPIIFREFAIISLLFINLISLILNGVSSSGLIYVVNIAIGVYIYLLMAKSKFILIFIDYIYGAWLIGAILHFAFFIGNIYKAEGQARDFFSISGDHLLKVPNDIVYFMIAFSVSIKMMQFFHQKIFNSIFIVIFFILLMYASLLLGGRSVLLYSLILVIGLIMDSGKNIKKLTIIFLGFIFTYLYFNYGKYNSSVYRLLDLSPLCDGRIPQWLLALDIGMDNFWIGAGSSEFGRQWNTYILNPIGDSCFYIDTRAISWPHNLLLEQFSSSGIFSFILLVYLLYTMISFYFKAANARILSGNVVFYLAMIIYALSCLLDLTFYRLWVSICFFMILYTVEFKFLTDYSRRIK